MNVDTRDNQLFSLVNMCHKLPLYVNCTTKSILVTAASHLEMSSHFKSPFLCPVSEPNTNHISQHWLYVHPCSPCRPYIFLLSLQNRFRINNYCIYCSIWNVVTTEENRFKVYFIYFLTYHSD